MRHHLILLSFVVLFSAAMPSLAQEGDGVKLDGAELYKAAISAAKLQPQPGNSTLQAIDEKEALKISQDAIGNQLGDYTFLGLDGRKVRLSDFRGKPLIISMIYTHCPTVCATTTKSLSALKQSQDTLGPDSFGVLTIGFDAENDTPEAMDDYAKRLDVNMPNWQFVSADPDTIRKLSKDLGFSFSPAPEGGFNHITQTTLVDRKGKVNLQIYGDEFENRTLIEPLKNLIYNVNYYDPIYKTTGSSFANFGKSVHLFCTVYDPTTGKYATDYRELAAMGIDAVILFLIARWIVIEFRRSNRKRNYPDHA